jgi:predicted NACHT family NTPase
LILLGDPGSGKSSFTNHLLFRCADYLLDKNTNRLPAKWPAKHLVPIRILLRELAIDLKNANAHEWSDLPNQNRDHKMIAVVDAHLEKQLQENNASAFYPALQANFMAGDCLVVLDGLDEVPVELKN